MTSTPRLLSAITQSMKHLAHSQRVISENIANSETPGFKARVVAAPEFSSLVDALGGNTGKPRVDRPRVSLSSGMVGLGARPPQAGSGVMLDRDTSETKPDGNNVTLEDQLLKMGAVQADYTAMTNLYRKQLGLLKSAVGRG
jgi:flagellar basal-body rod protein FlgB